VFIEEANLSELLSSGDDKLGAFDAIDNWCCMLIIKQNSVSFYSV
jgi:hypothetical protein